MAAWTLTTTLTPRSFTGMSSRLIPITLALVEVLARPR